MNKFKSILLLPILFLITFFIVGCGEEKFDWQINFETNGGTTISAIKANSNDQIDKPTDPEKDEYDFGGWYYDSNLTLRVYWPIIVGENYSLYAQWIPNTINLQLSNNVASWKPFSSAVYQIEIDETIVDNNYTLTSYTLPSIYNDGYQHNLKVTYNDITENQFYQAAKQNSVQKPTNLRVENSLLKWLWTNDDYKYNFTGFKIFVNGELYKTQYAPQLVLSLLVQNYEKKIYKIELYATTTNFYDSEVLKFYYDYSENQYNVTLHYQDSITPNLILTTENNFANLPSATKTGYIFNGWYTSNNSGKTLMRKWTKTNVVLKNLDLYADWAEEKVETGKTVLKSPLLELAENSIYWSDVDNTNSYVVYVKYIDAESQQQNFQYNVSSREFDFGIYSSYADEIEISIMAQGNGVTTVNSTKATRTINFLTYYPNIIGEIEYDANIGVFYWNSGMTNFDISLFKNSILLQTIDSVNAELLIEDATLSGQLTLVVNKLTNTVSNYRLATPDEVFVLDYNDFYYVVINDDSNCNSYNLYKDNILLSSFNTSSVYLNKSNIDFNSVYTFVLKDRFSNYFESKPINIDFSNSLCVNEMSSNLFVTDNNKIIFSYNSYMINLTADFNLLENESITKVYEESGCFFALTNLGRLFSWGSNQSNFILLDNPEIYIHPQEITSKFNINDNDYITNIYAEYETFYVSTNLGKWYTWGFNKYLLANQFDYVSFPTEISSKFSLANGDKIIYITSDMALSELGNTYTISSQSSYPVSWSFQIGSSVEKIKMIDFNNFYAYLLTTDNLFYILDYSSGRFYWQNVDFDLSATDYIKEIKNDIIYTNENRMFYYLFNASYGYEIGLGTNTSYFGLVEITDIVTLDEDETIIDFYFGVLLTSKGNLYIWGNDAYYFEEDKEARYFSTPKLHYVELDENETITKIINGKSIVTSNNRVIDL